MPKIEKEKLKKPPRLIGRLAGSIILSGAVSLATIIIILYFIINYIPISIPNYILIGLTPLYYITAKWIFNLTFLAITRAQLKPVEEGNYKIDPRDKNVKNWLINTVLVKAATHFMGDPPLGQLAFNTFVFKMLGSRMGHGATAQDITDPYLVEMGEGATAGGNSLLATHAAEPDRLYFKRVKIGKGALVGAYSLIFPGVEIGDNAMVAAYSCVLKDTKIPPKTIWAGVPAKQISPKPK